MKQKLLNGFYFFMSRLGIFRLFYWLNRNKKIVLTYHNIIPDDLFDGSVHLGVSHSQSVFENQIKLIKRRASQNKILITFDDGYKNQIEIAAKILEKHGLQGVYFISFKSLLSTLPLTIDKIMQWVSYVPVGEYKIFDRQFKITDHNRNEIASWLYETLLSNYELWDDIITALNNVYAYADLKIKSALDRLRFSPMEPSDLEILSKNGHVVAAHGWDHKPLSTLPIEIQRQDFSLCKTHAEKYCNSRLYSYPYGGKQEVSPETIRLCAEHGFSAAYMNNQSALNFKGESRAYQLPRISLPNDRNLIFFDAKVSGFESFCKRLFGILTWKRRTMLNG